MLFYAKDCASRRVCAFVQRGEEETERRKSSSKQTRLFFPRRVGNANKSNCERGGNESQAEQEKTKTQ